jgi:hypothetical protein
MSEGQDYRTYDAYGKETTPIDVRVRLREARKQETATYVAVAAWAEQFSERKPHTSGYPHSSAADALRQLTDDWCLPGIVLQITDDGEVSPVYRLARNGVIFKLKPCPVADAHGGVYCPKCHAAPNLQEPQYAGRGEGIPRATGVVRCTADECGHLYRPVPLA